MSIECNFELKMPDWPSMVVIWVIDSIGLVVEGHEVIVRGVQGYHKAESTDQAPKIFSSLVETSWDGA